ncbi:hypothetical protein [Chitinophaga sp. XS-30]|uniref:hypothetical protein n=1 Tax=Chitinophaga sp. XS-30 TaxID=2604421 RepID=UPI0011DD1B27|nr:hypothetical protein [Chitinophaga sp. XS-30]QEH42938.1 hypothetical protein FW415_19510 [Chitinophaga sp. XS-30]
MKRQFRITRILCLAAVFTGAEAIAQQGYTARTTATVWELNGTRNDATANGPLTNARADFEAQSSFPQNPTGSTSPWRFDFSIRQFTNAGSFSGELTYYVNSRDGSIAIPGEALRRYLPATANLDFDLHFAIRKANGDFIICGNHAQLGRAGMELGADADPNELWTNTYLDQMQWLGSIASTPQHPVTPPDDAWANTVTAYRGKVYLPEERRDQYLKMYFVNFPSSVHTSVPVMGIGVGVFKHFRDHANRLLIYSIAEQVPVEGSGRVDITSQLLGLYRAEAVFDPSPYRITTFGTQKGINDAKTLSAEMQDKLQRVAQLEQQRKACPKGTAGSACREALDIRIKQLKEEVKEQVDAFKRKHGLIP